MEWLKELIESLSAKIDKVDEKLDTQNAILHQQHLQISEHIRRTELAEKNIELLRSQVLPLQERDTQLMFIFKSVGFVATIVGIGAGIAAILDYLRQ